MSEIIEISNAEPERIFSDVNLTKTDIRNSMNIESLND